MVFVYIESTNSDRNIQFEYFGKNKSNANEHCVRRMMELAFKVQGHLQSDEDSYVYEEERNNRSAIFTWKDDLGTEHVTRFEVYGIADTKTPLAYYPVSGALIQTSFNHLPEPISAVKQTDHGIYSYPINNGDNCFVNIIDLKQYINFKHVVRHAH
jgi:hypothetical protein